jgi:glyoxylase-like metal-dependent hydrolase (beta-lactamase superfamily II)
MLIDTKVNLPYYGNLNLFVSFHERKDIDTCAVNMTAKGMNFYYNSEFLQNLSQKEVNFIALHEDFHLLWNHPKRTITGQYDLLGNDKVVLLPLPGHTPGMIGAIVNLDQDGSFLLASDAVPMKANLDLELNPKNTWNSDLSLLSMIEVRRIQAGGVQVLFGHDDEQWQSLRKGLAFYE